MDDSDQLYRVDGSKVWLSVTAREWAKQYGMSDRDFARYLMNRQRLGDDYEGTVGVGLTDDLTL